MPLNIRSEERLHCLQHQRQALAVSIPCSTLLIRASNAISLA